MTKKQAFALFRKYIKSGLIPSCVPDSDKVWYSYNWAYYTQWLCDQWVITEYEYRNWVNPYGQND